MSKIALLIYNFCFLLHSKNIPFIPIIINKLVLRLLFSCQIGLGAKIGENCMLGYGGLGVVIHKNAIIGKKVNIGTNVTIGGTSKKNNVPVIGNSCIIATGAKIIGPITIGNNCVIGANAVVIDNIPDNCVVVGVPAKIVKRNIDIFTYRTI